MNDLRNVLLIGGTPSKREEESITRKLVRYGKHSYIHSNVFDYNEGVIIYLNELFSRDTLMLRVATVVYRLRYGSNVTNYYVFFNDKMGAYINSDDLSKYLKNARMPSVDVCLLKYLIKYKIKKTKAIKDVKDEYKNVYVKQGEGYYWREGKAAELPHIISNYI